MKITHVFFDPGKKLPASIGCSIGDFVDPSNPLDLQPSFYCRTPVTRMIWPILKLVPLDGTRTWVGAELITLEDSVIYLPNGSFSEGAELQLRGIEYSNPRKWLTSAVLAAERMFKEFLERDYAIHLAKAVAEMPDAARRKFFQDLRMPPRTYDRCRSQLVAAINAPSWQKRGLSWGDAAKEAAEQGIKITAGSLRKLAERGLIQNIHKDIADEQ